MNPIYQSLIEQNNNLAIAFFSDSKEIKPVFTLHCQDKGLLILTAWGDDREKLNILNLVRLLICKHEAFAYSTIFESWVAQRPMGENVVPFINGPVSAQPDKKEIIMTTFVTRDFKQVDYFPINRDNEGNPTLGEKQSMGSNCEGLVNIIDNEFHQHDSISEILVVKVEDEKEKIVLLK